MKRAYFFLFCSFALGGCVNFTGLHSYSKPFTVAALSQCHRYALNDCSARCQSVKKSAMVGWWNSFQDDQLSQLILVALADSPDMQIAKDRVRKAQYDAQIAAATLWPSIDLGGYAQRQRFSQTGLVPPPFNGKTFNIGDVALNLNYEFDFWGKNREILAASQSEACAALADFCEARLVISAAVAALYTQLQSDLSQLSTAKKLVTVRQEIFDLAAVRTRYELTSAVPLEEALASLQAAKILVDRYEKSSRLGRDQLAVLLGKNPCSTDIAVKPADCSKYCITLPKILPAHLLANRYDIVATRAYVEAAAHRVKVAKARFFPDINLNLLYSYQSVFIQQLFQPGNQNNAVTVAFDLPIFDAGRRRGELGSRYAEYDAAVDRYNQTILTALREVADQLASLRSICADISAQQKALKAIKYNDDISNTKYIHGLVDETQRLQTKELVLQQRIVLTDLQTQYKLIIIALIKALGGCDFCDLCLK